MTSYCQSQQIIISNFTCPINKYSTAYHSFLLQTVRLYHSGHINHKYNHKNEAGMAIQHII